MLRLTIRIILTIIVLLLFLLPFFVTSKMRNKRANGKCVRLAFYLGCALWGIKVKTQGRISQALPLLVVSNHFSYLDVFALGSSMEMCFTPKSEVAGWPVIGFFCKITGCIFIDRRPSQTLRNKSNLDDAIAGGSIVSLFPEGTSNDGSRLLPFKSSFFSIAENQGLTVQPVSVVYTRLNDESITSENRHIVGWYGDMEFFPHLMTFLRQKSLEVTLVFHDAVNSKDFTSRKELASYCQDVIGKGLSYC